MYFWNNWPTDLVKPPNLSKHLRKNARNQNNWTADAPSNKMQSRLIWCSCKFLFFELGVWRGDLLPHRKKGGLWVGLFDQSCRNRLTMSGPLQPLSKIAAHANDFAQIYLDNSILSQEFHRHVWSGAAARTLLFFELGVRRGDLLPHT